MTDATAFNYLRDLGLLVKTAALDSRAQKELASDEADRAFATGRLTAYYEVVSLMQQQAVAFGIDPATIGLNEIHPDRDLI